MFLFSYTHLLVHTECVCFKEVTLNLDCGSAKKGEKAMCTGRVIMVDYKIYTR